MRNHSLPIGLAMLMLAGSSAARADEAAAWRLFVADREKPVIHVIDAVTGKGLESFPLDSPAAVYSSQSGRTVFAVQADAHRVSAISTGISFSDHGDHGDIEIEAPKKLDIEIAGQKPVHFVDHGGRIAIFFDGEGTASMFDEQDAHSGSAEFSMVSAGAPHHGVAAAFGDYTVVSQPHPEKPSEELPVGLRVLDSAAQAVGSLHECPDLHGEAISGSLTAFACGTGLLVARDTADAPEIRFVPYPESLPDGKVTTLVGGRSLQYFLGNYGPRAVVLIDPEEDAFRLVELPTRRVHFAVDPVRAKFAYVFTEDGKLHRLNVLSGTLTDSLALTEPYSMDGHWNDPRPRIAVAGDSIVVTDPLKGRLHVIDAERFAKTGEFPVEGRPFNIVAVGGSGERH